MEPWIAAPNDTIVALASGPGRAAIAVVRVSGRRTCAALEALCGGVPPPRHAALREIGPRGAALDRGLVLFFLGLFFVTQAYTMAFHGVYVDCFAPNVPGCTLSVFNEPTLTAALYGTVLAFAATATFYLGARALRWVQRPE